MITQNLFEYHILFCKPSISFQTLDKNLNRIFKLFKRLITEI